MSAGHVCTFTFVKNVQHIHVHDTPSANGQPVSATSAKRGLYRCECGNRELRDPVPDAQHLPPDDTEGGSTC